MSTTEGPRRSFSDAPELATSGEAEPAAEETIEADAESWQRRAEVAEGALADVQESQLEELAFLDPEEVDPEWVADRLLEAGGGPRLQNFVASWAFSDGAAAEAWTASRETAVTRYALEEETQGLRQKIAADQAERQRIGEAFAENHQDVAGSFLGEQAVGLPVATSELEATLTETYAGLQNADRANRQAEAVRELRAAFRAPTAADVLHGHAPKEAPPEVSEQDVTARMRPPSALVETQREQRMADFRAAFAEEAEFRFGRGAEPR